MNGLLIINKPKDVTSRDVVDMACKKLQTKKIGHTGTLDPLATGVLVLCVNRATKLVEIITQNEKEYIASFKFGVKTDTGDITGNILKETNIEHTKKEINDALNSMKGEYDQTVPIYSAVKVNGRKLYEYARNNEEVELPVRKVEIKEIELINIENDIISFRVIVSKGTYIRSLIEDIAEKLGDVATMTDLCRSRQGQFKLSDTITVDEISEDSIIPTKSLKLDYKKVIATDLLLSKVKNGALIDNIYKDNEILFIDQEENLIGIYQVYLKDETKMKPIKMF